MNCDAHMRPFPNDTELSCELGVDDHDTHHAVLRDYAYPGSTTTIEWNDADRRTFHGPWPGECDVEHCPLPSGHHGNHVLA